MSDWWSLIGQSSVLTGVSLGLAWASIATAQRRARFLRAAMRPIDQSRWFMLHFVCMGSYLCLLSALGLMAVDGLIPVSMLWFLLIVSGAAFAAAISITMVREPLPATPARAEREPPIEPPAPAPVTPWRRSA